MGGCYFAAEGRASMVMQSTELSSSRRVGSPGTRRTSFPNRQRKEIGMSKLASLDDLFVHELQEAHQAEDQIKSALPSMVKAATSPDLKDVFITHRREIEEHLYRLSHI